MRQQLRGPACSPHLPEFSVLSPHWRYSQPNSYLQLSPGGNLIPSQASTVIQKCVAFTHAEHANKNNENESLKATTNTHMRLGVLLDLLVVQAGEGYEFRNPLNPFVSDCTEWYLSSFESCFYEHSTLVT